MPTSPALLAVVAQVVGHSQEWGRRRLGPGRCRKAWCLVGRPFEHVNWCSEFLGTPAHTSGRRFSSACPSIVWFGYVNVGWARKSSGADHGGGITESTLRSMVGAAVTRSYGRRHATSAMASLHQLS